MTYLRYLISHPVFAAASHRGTLCDMSASMNDGCGIGGISFCNDGTDTVGLIPDNHFLVGEGYETERLFFNDQPAWDVRSDTPFWRGASTGRRLGTDILSLPRVKLCQFAAERNIDAAITQLVQSSETELSIISPYMSSYSSWKELSSKKYNIDIDGNTSSWPGLFLKLLAGGVVLKVKSPWQQWYYDKLKPWENFVPIQADFSDFEEAIDRLRNDQSLARQIALSGRSLAVNMTYKEAIRCGVENIEALSSRLSFERPAHQIHRGITIVSSAVMPVGVHKNLVARDIMTRLYGGDIWTGFSPSHEGDGQGWNGNHPTLSRLTSTPGSKIVVDVGVWKGQSTITLASAMKRNNIDGVVIAVDTFLGSPEHWSGDHALFRRKAGRPDLYDIFMSNVHAAGLQDYIIPMPQTSSTACKVLAALNIHPNIVHIDASHEYREAIQDMSDYWEILETDGFLIGDDYHWTWPGIIQAAGEFSARKRKPLVVEIPKFIIQKTIS